MSDLIKFFGWRQPTRTYANMTLTGYEVLVTSATKTHVEFVTHDLWKVYSEKVSTSEFFSHFVPDLKLTPRDSIKSLLCAGNMMKRIPDAWDLLTAAAKNPFSIEGFKVTVQKQPTEARVLVDFNKRSCIELYRAEGLVYYIPMLSSGLDIFRLTEQDFGREFIMPLNDYSVVKAAKLYIESAKHLGATKDAMKALALLSSPTSSKEIEMATAKKPTVTKETKVSNAETKKSVTKTPAKPSKPVVEKTVKVAAKAKPPVKLIHSGGIKGIIESGILAGLSNEDILKNVKKENPHAQTGVNSIRFYKTKLKAAGKL